MAEKAIVRADNTLERIDPNIDPNVGLKAGLTLMDVERVTVNNATIAYTQSAVTQGVVSGKWRITTTISDKTGAALTAAKADVVSNADRALAAGLKDAFNALFLLNNQVRALNSQSALTLAQFKTAVDGLTSIDQTAFNNWLQSKI